jgi:hypothetical protein
MTLQEKETQFSEGVDIDEKQGVEVFGVPARDVEAANFYHDFKTVRPCSFFR